jgi:hypothetical protein
VFGNIPPKEDFPSSKSYPPVSKRTSTEAYKESLNSLLYLAQNDQAGFAKLMDTIDNHPGDVELRSSLDLNTDSDLENPSPTSRNTRHHGPLSRQSDFDPDPTAHSAKRERSAKLANFFGERNVNSDQPPQLAPPSKPAREKSMTGRGKARARLETLEGVISEMWEGVQSEVKKGKVGGDEGRKVGELMDALRRKSVMGLGA